MAIKNIEMQHLNGNGTYDIIYPKTSSANSIISNKAANEIGLPNNATVDNALRIVQSNYVSSNGGNSSVGHVLTTVRTDLDDTWKLCDGTMITENWPVADFLPYEHENKYICPLDGANISSMYVVNEYSFCSEAVVYDGTYQGGTKLHIINIATNADKTLTFKKEGISPSQNVLKGVIYYNGYYWAFFKMFIMCINLDSQTVQSNYIEKALDPYYVFIAGGNPYYLCKDGLYKLTLLSESSVTTSKIHEFDLSDASCAYSFCNNKLIMQKSLTHKTSEDDEGNYEYYDYVLTLCYLDFNGTSFSAPAYTVMENRFYNGLIAAFKGVIKFEYIGGKYYIVKKSNDVNFGSVACVGSDLSNITAVTGVDINISNYSNFWTAIDTIVKNEKVYILYCKTSYDSYYSPKDYGYMKIFYSAQIDKELENITEWISYSNNEYDYDLYYTADSDDPEDESHAYYVGNNAIMENSYLTAVCMKLIDYNIYTSYYQIRALKRYKILPQISLSKDTKTYIKVKEQEITL